MVTQLKTDTQEQATTANGGLTQETSFSANVDLFFLAGASRGKDLTEVFNLALAEDEHLATRILQWTRDVRGGAGERQTFRDLLTEMADNDHDFVSRILVKIPVIGRWDDVLVLFGTSFERKALQLIAQSLKDGDGLCAKWMPRKGVNGNKIRSYMRLTPKAYRKLLVGLSNTVEQNMCAKEFDKIEYGKIPSLAAARYQAAFKRNDESRYDAYITSLEKGEEKINASAVYPYDVIKSLKTGNSRVATQQWKALPDYLAGSDENILPVVDVSGSMMCPAGGYGSRGTTTCMDVSLSLGLYLSERMGGVFKDNFVTFSSNPVMQKLTGNLSERHSQLRRSEWGMNTNIKAVFEVILESAVLYKIPVSEMPTKILILSDMEFDSCVTTSKDDSCWYTEREDVDIVGTYDMINQEYEKAGYKRPDIVFWNLNGRAGNVPVNYDETGTALVSGFSPAIMTSILGGEDLTPQGVMLKTVMKERYDF